MPIGSLTVKAYYKHFGSVFGGITAFVGVLPFLSAIIPSNYSKYLFPPLGTVESFARIGAFALVIVTTIVVYQLRECFPLDRTARRQKLFVILLLTAILSFIVFIGLNIRFVRAIPAPSISPTAEFIVTVGWNRTDFALKTFGEKSDEEMLRARGLTEEEIFRLWTEWSVITARLLLLATYIVFLLGAVSIGSFAVMFDKLESLQRPNSHCDVSPTV